MCDLDPKVIDGEVGASRDSNFIESTTATELQVLSCNHMTHKEGASMACVPAHARAIGASLPLTPIRLTGYASILVFWFGFGSQRPPASEES